MRPTHTAMLAVLLAALATTLAVKTDLVGAAPAGRPFALQAGAPGSSCQLQLAAAAPAGCRAAHLEAGAPLH